MREQVLQQQHIDLQLGIRVEGVKMDPISKRLTGADMILLICDSNYGFQMSARLVLLFRC
jgi:hypothetical protein